MSNTFYNEVIFKVAELQMLQNKLLLLFTGVKIGVKTLNLLFSEL